MIKKILIFFFDFNFNKQQKIMNIDQKQDQNSKNNKPSFKEWLSEKNITFIIITILVIYAIERFVKNVHNELIPPVIEKCLNKIGYTPDEKHKRELWQKIMIYILELTFMMLFLFFLSRFIFGHTNTNSQTKNNNNINKNDLTFDNNKNDNNNKFSCPHCYHCQYIDRQKKNK
jgi:large-conductance mechanosensitive channel